MPSQNAFSIARTMLKAFCFSGWVRVYLYI